ncbi:MAG: DUF3150 domain-containing protein [Bacillota bacterium]
MGTEERRRAIAERLGLDPAEIRVAEPPWSRIFEEGVLVRLRISYFRGQQRLVPEDLGLDEDPAARQEILVQLGKKHVVPKWMLDRGKAIESRARRLLEENSFQVAFGRFMPPAAYRRFREELAPIRAEFLEFRDEVGDTYADLKRSVLDAYEDAARKAYRRLSRTAGASEPEDAWVGRYLSRIEEAFPSREKLLRSFSFEVAVSMLASPADVERERAEVERLRAEGRLREEEYRQRLQALKDTRATLDATVNELLGQLKTQVYEAVSEVLQATQKNGQLVGASVQQLRNLVERIRALNFMEDQDIEDAARQIESLLSRGPRNRTTEDVVGLLRDIGVVTRRALLELGEAPRSARAVGIPDEIPEDLAEEARGRLARRGLEAGELPLVFDSDARAVRGEVA